jgi:hypothetical protein
MISKKSLTVQTEYPGKSSRDLDVFATWVLAVVLGAAFWTLVFTRVFPMLIRLIVSL